MNPYNFAPIRALLTGAYWVITHLTDLLLPIAGASSAALAIVLLTFIVRSLLIPVGISQAKAQATRTRLAPKINEMNKKYRAQPDVLRQKMMEMYAEEGASPAAGCLPVLAQMPILMAVYGLFIQPTINGRPNGLLGYSLFGVPLDTGLIGHVGAGTLTPGVAGVYAGLIMLIAVVAYITRRSLTPTAGATSPSGGTSEPAPGIPNMAGMAKAMSFLPFMTAVIAAVVPLAAGLYLATTTTWTLVERLVLKARFTGP